MADDWPDRARLPRAGGVAPEGESICILDPGHLLTEAQRRLLADRAAAAAAELDLRGEVRVRLVADTEMAAAHEKYAGVPGTTDVLTFDLRSSPQADLDADLYACVDEARRQAAARGHAVGDELLLYIVHGILHCLGHDDHDDASSAQMHEEEDRVLRAIGVGPVFAGAPGAVERDR